MTTVCFNFPVPLYVIYREYLYLSGYSYFHLNRYGETSCSYPSREELDALPDLRWAISNRSEEKALAILDLYPNIPRLLTSARGRYDKDAHLIFLGMLIYRERIEDLKRLYGVAISGETDEVFGSVLIHHPSFPSRTETRGIRMEQIVGNGSFGIIFFNNSRLLKFGLMSVEYCREFLVHMMLMLTEEGLSPEARPVTHVTEEMIPHHMMSLHRMSPITRSSNLIGQLERLYLIVGALRDRFIMHLDISTTNIMWDNQLQSVRLIDCAGTIGDDSFFNLGHTVNRVCTRSTRPPEYCSSDTLWQRNESSETLSAYYALMSYSADPSLINVLPQMKEPVRRDSKLDEASRIKMCRRPTVEYLTDREALPPSHLRDCLKRFVSRWPRSSSIRHDPNQRKKFIENLIKRVDLPGDLGGLAKPVMPPPYITIRCVALYDALRDIGDPSLEPYMDDPALVNALLYISLAPCKMDLLDIEHYPDHPVHIILQIILRNPSIVSIFLSPITAFCLILRGETQKIIRCLYNLRRDRRCRPMDDPRVACFVRDYMSKILVEPLIIQDENAWWNMLLETDRSLLVATSRLTIQAETHIENVIRAWF